MKKFLTVLLALSVVFTYTVGTAFAATGVTVSAKADTTYTLSDVETAIYAQAQKNVGMLDSVKSNFLTNYSANKVTIDGVTYSKDAIEKVIDKVFTDIATKINTVADAQKEAALAASKGVATYKVYTGDYKTGLYIDNQGKTAATKENSFTEQTYSKAGLTEAIEGGTVVYDASLNKLADANDWSNEAKYYTKTSSVTWYEVNQAAAPFPGYFTEAQKTAYETAVNTEYLKYDTAAEIEDYIVAQANTYKKDLITAEHAVQKAEVTALIAKVDATKYSADIPSTADKSSKYYISAENAPKYGLASEGYYSYQDQVKAIVAKATADLAAKDVASSDDYAAIKTKYTAIANETTFFAPYKALIDAIPTTQNEQWDNEDLAQGQDRIVAAMKQHLADAKGAEYSSLSTTIRDLQRKEAQGTTLTTAEKTQLQEAQTALAALDNEYAAVEEVYTNIIKAYTLDKVKTYFETNGTIKTEKVAEDFPVSTPIKTLSAAKVAKVQDLKAEADSKLKMTGLDGSLMYDKDAVEKALEKAIAEAYAAADKTALDKVTLNVNPNQDLVKAEMNKVLTGAEKVEFNKKFYPTVANWSSSTTVYDEEKAKEAKAVIDATKEAIRAAKTVEAVDEAFLAGYAKYDAIPTLQDRENVQNTDAYKNQAKSYATEIGILIDNKVARLGGEANFKAAYGTSSSDLKTKLVGNTTDNTGLYEAYTVDEMKTIYDDIAATVNDLKTTADLNAELTALNTAIGAVKVPVTAESKETILALNKQVKEFQDYAAKVGFNTSALRTSLLTSLTDSIAEIDAKEITDAVAEIMKDGKISLDEKDAVNKVVGLVDAYAENYGTVKKNTLVNGNANVKKVYEYDFTTQEVKAVEDAIAVIDPTASPLDVAAIEAARAAYDALGEATISPEMYAKLLSLETLVKENKIAAVEALKITASSKQGKNYIKVKWTVKGDADAADGYQIYRSTKKNSGYKKFFTTAKKTYKNTKSLKKGTRYYYKVRAYKVVDGKTYYSDWSNKAYRIAK